MKANRSKQLFSYTLRSSRLMLIAVTMLFAASQFAGADEWRNWRGPTQDGRAVGDEFPITWSNTKNILWSHPLPGRGASTPIISGNHLFLTYVEDDLNVGVCLDRDGKQLWRVELGEARDSKHKKASGANSSPVTDGSHVYFYFKSGDLGCFDFDGNELWRLNLQTLLGKDTLWWDLGTSPVLTDTCVVVCALQSGNSYIAAFAKDSGQVVWKHDREMNAPNESNQSYTTPIVLNEGADQSLLVVGADWITCHDASDGKERWRVGGLNPDREQFFRSIATPMVAGGVAYVPYARGETLTAVRLGGDGDVTETHVNWTVEQFAADVPTPTISEGRIYICGDKTCAYCLNAESGELIWKGDLERDRNAFSASPVVAGGHVYMTREDGTTFVIKDSDQFEIVATNRLDEMTVATPVPVDGRIYLRTYDHLYCIGRTGESGEIDSP